MPTLSSELWKRGSTEALALEGRPHRVIVEVPVASCLPAQHPPRLQHKPPRPVLAVRLLFLLLQHPERLAGEVQVWLGGDQVRAGAGGVFPRVQDVL